MAKYRRSSGSGSSSGGGSGVGGGTGGLPSSGDIQKKIDAIDPTKFTEMEALLMELEQALAREAEEAANQNNNNGNQDPPSDPVPPSNPVDEGGTPNNDGSGIRHQMDGGYSHEFTVNEDGTYNYSIYDPTGELYYNVPDSKLDQFGQGDNAKEVIDNWFVSSMNETNPGWDDTTSEFFQNNFPDQYTGEPTVEEPTVEEPTGEEPTGEQPTGEQPTGGEDPLADVSYTAPDGTTIDFSSGNTNKGYVELDNQIDGLIDDYEDAETDEDKESALALLNKADENLAKFAENMTEISDGVSKQYEKELAINKDLLEIINSDSASEEQIDEANKLLAVSSTKLNRLADGYNKVNNLNTRLNEETSKDLQAVLDGEEDEQDFFDKSLKALKWSALGVGTLAAGSELYDTWFGDEDTLDTKSASETMAEANEAIEQNLPKALELQKQFQPEIDNLENQSNYNKLFGVNPSSEFFNSDPKWQGEYDKYLLGPDGLANSGDEPETPLGKSEWLDQWMKDNPDSQDALDYRDSYSRVGAQEKLLQRNMTNASNLYKPEEMGGMGFAEDDFRTKDQRKTMKLANELIDSPVNSMLEDSVMSELGKGGDMGDAYYGNMRNNILGGLAPSLAKQGGLLSGGVQRLAREMTGDYQRTLQGRQQAAGSYLNQRGSQLNNFSNLANANTVSPSSVFGLPSGSQLTGQAYAQAAQPTGSQLLADPTSAYASSVGQQDLLNSLLQQASQQSTSEKLTNTYNSTNSLINLVEQGEDLLN